METKPIIESSFMSRFLTFPVSYSVSVNEYDEICLCIGQNVHCMNKREFDSFIKKLILAQERM